MIYATIFRFIRIWSNPFGAPGRKKPPNLPDRAANTLIQSNTAQSKCNNDESNLKLKHNSKEIHDVFLALFYLQGSE